MELFNDNWYFLKTAFGTEYEQVEKMFSQFEAVDIPHDWLIWQTNDLYETSTGWYMKKFDKAEMKLSEGERAVIVFDGVYMDSTTYLNGKRLGDWKYGYSAFNFDLTDYLEDTENLLVVQVRFQSPNSRWYSGAGIYRNVWIHKYPKIYIPLDGIYVHSKYQQNGIYELDMETEISGQDAKAKKISCHYTLWDREKMSVDLGWQTDISNQYDMKVFAMKTTISLEQYDILEWDIENPKCYQLKAELYDESKHLLDSQVTTIGFRRMEFDADTGFYLNGTNIKIHGACEHHDLGCLGAAFYKEAMKRKLLILKQMGVNAIRTSHNMPAREVMELADELGILVLSESFDMWEGTKTEYDYGRFFKEWARKDVHSWIRRDRNHPSLFMWSIGNEIYDTHASAYGQEITRRLISYVREYDYKKNALITIGSNYMPWEGAQNCADIVKMAGYNYGEKCYEEHHKKHPDWIIYGSETASTVQSRGVYRFPLSKSVLADEDEQCSCLGNSSTSWGAKSTESCIITDRNAKFCFGQFIWTGFDYIGEPTPYHTKNSYFGQLDTAGFAKDTFYIYQAEWTSVKKAPMVHIFPYWCFNEGQMIDIRACSNAASVALWVNGEYQGKQSIDHENGDSVVCNWSVPYHKGEICAVAYDMQGNEVAREKRYSFEDGKKLTITSDKDILMGNGEDLAFLTVGVEDANGHLVENAMDYVSVAVTGEGRLLGLDNGDSTDYEPYKTTIRKLFNGKLLIVVASKAQAGEICVKVKAANLESAEYKISVKPSQQRNGISIMENQCDMFDEADSDRQLLSKPCMVRQIALKSNGGTHLSKEKREVTLEAEIYPENASDRELIWEAVNDSGIPLSYIQLEVSQENPRYVKVTANGDGTFFVRCMSKSSTQKIKIISQLEFKAEGIGTAKFNPYEFLSAGLYTKAIGEIGNGNEKGIATARDGVSGVSFENVDFGDYGTDEITVWIFALSSEEYPVKIWLGAANEPDSELILDTVYQKSSVWNVYQEETWKLKRRIKGVVTLTILMEQKVHIKGFVCKKYEKAFCRLNAGECSRIYGDSFTVSSDKTKITDIGNNVTVIYENMDFGQMGASKLMISSRSELKNNTVHIHFRDENDITHNRMIEVAGNDEYTNQTFELEPLYGKGTLEFIFLPGTKFDWAALQFFKV